MKRGMDAFLKDRMDEYDKWLKGDKIAFSSRVIPVRESLSAKQWVIPTEQVLAILEAATTIALAKCVCRSHYKRCDHPVEVCLLLNDVGNRIVSKGHGRHISLQEASAVVKTANERGLVHLSLYRPDHELYALCSCCRCCCHDLQLLLTYDRRDLVVHSDYVAVVDNDACTGCGTCVDRCVFGACQWNHEEVIHDLSACYGCGLCVTTCPGEAISLHPRS
jgi:ferredoxin